MTIDEEDALPTTHTAFRVGERWTNPPADGQRRIGTGAWSYGRGRSHPLSFVIEKEQDRILSGPASTVLSLRFAHCDVTAWDEWEPWPECGPKAVQHAARPKIGEAIISVEQARYLRDALTELLDKEPA